MTAPSNNEFENAETVVSQTPTNALCLHCGYALRALPSKVCPECGNSFDPTDSRTYRAKSNRSFLQAWNRPLRLWEVALWVVIAAAYLEGYSRPLGLHSLLYSVGLVFCISPFLLFFLAIVALLRALAAFEYKKQDNTVRKRYRARWVIVALCFFCIASPSFFEWPLYLRFLASKSQFEEVVRSRKYPLAKSQIGLYWTRVYDKEGNVFFWTDHDMIATGPHWGFAWCPAPPKSTQRGAGPRYHPFFGNWYIWSSH